jgi:hypothetical protein
MGRQFRLLVAAMKTIGCLLVLSIVEMVSLSSCKQPAPPPADLPPPPPSIPLNSEKLKQIAALIESPKAEWLQALGEPDREIPPGDTLPRDAGETDWEFDRDVEVDVSWFQTKEGVLPWDITFLHINGKPDASVLEADLLVEFFGLSRSKSDDQKGDYEWTRPDGSVSAEYHTWGSGDPDFGGLHIYVEKPGGEPVPSADELENNPGKKGSPNKAQ